MSVDLSWETGQAFRKQLEAQAPSRKGNHLALGMALMGQGGNEDLVICEVSRSFESTGR